MIKCDYCGGVAQLVTGKKIYPHRPDLYGKNFYFCENGHEPAYVGCHGGSSKALGRLADSSLRKLKSAAHSAFDPLWKYGSMNRIGAYQWLSQKTGIPFKECHIGMMSEDQCHLVIKVCNEKTKR